MMLIAAVVLAAVVGVVVYFGAGWSKMESVCTLTPPGGREFSAVEYGFSLVPFGFECTFADGRVIRSAWMTPEDVMVDNVDSRR